MAEPTFDDLTTAEVKSLYRQTRAVAQKQRAIEQEKRGNKDLGIDGDYYLDSFGNVIFGQKPPAKRDRHYISSEGYVVDLKEGEVAPDNLLAPGATGIERLTHFINENLSDPEIAALLPQEEHVFTTNFNDYLIVGSFDKGEWKIRAQDEVGDNPDIKFRMPGRLDQDEAASHARNYVKNAIALRFRDLSEIDINKIQRLAASNRDAALSLYICARLPKKLEQEFVRLGAEAEITGSTMKLLEFTANPEINPIVEEAVYAVWYWSKPGVELTPELDAFIQERTADRVLTFALLDSLFQKFQTGRAINYLGSRSGADTAPTQEDLENLSDDQVSNLFSRTRIERARR